MKRLSCRISLRSFCGRYFFCHDSTVIRTVLWTHVEGIHLPRTSIFTLDWGFSALTVCFRVSTGRIRSPQSSWIVLCLFAGQNVRNVLNSNPCAHLCVCVSAQDRAKEWSAFLNEFEGLTCLELMRNRPARTMPVKMAASFSCPHWNALGQGCALPWWSYTRKHWKRRAPTM